MNSKLKSFFYKLRIIPVLVVVASMAFVVRLGDTYLGMKSLSGSAYAEEKKEPAETKPEQDKKVDDKKPEDDKKAEVAAPDEAALKSKDEVSPTSEAPKDKGAQDVSLPTTGKWQDASDPDSETSVITKEVNEDLSKRRAEIEAKEQKLSQREALLEAAQKELDRKLTEMEGLRDEIKGLLKQQSADEAARMQSLVKIYAGMKPKDAARIFNTLDTDILMDVIGQMPEAKASPIIALMEADRAKLLTTLLAEQKKLPDVP